MGTVISRSTATVERRWLDVRGAAVYLSMTETAIYTAANRHQLPFRRLGRKLMFDAVELDAYMHGLTGVDVAEAVARRLHNGTVKDLSN
jgi:excisionase family DNA binding protein